MAEKKLTVKQHIFVEEYLQSFNATQAAIKAGYKEKAAYSMGAENLKKPQIQAQIKKRVAELLGDTEALSLRIIEEQKALAFSNLSNFMKFDGDKITYEDFENIDTRAIQSLDIDKIGDGKKKAQVTNVKLKTHNKSAALDFLGKYVNLVQDVPADIRVDVNVVVDEVKKKLLK